LHPAAIRRAVPRAPRRDARCALAPVLTLFRPYSDPLPTLCRPLLGPGQGRRQALSRTLMVYVVVISVVFWSCPDNRSSSESTAMRAMSALFGVIVVRLGVT
jgi:hypothetical protein